MATEDIQIHRCPSLSIYSKRTSSRITSPNFIYFIEQHDVKYGTALTSKIHYIPLHYYLYDDQYSNSKTYYNVCHVILLTAINILIQEQVNTSSSTAAQVAKNVANLVTLTAALSLTTATATTASTSTAPTPAIQTTERVVRHHRGKRRQSFIQSAKGRRHGLHARKYTLIKKVTKNNTCTLYTK